MGKRIFLSIVRKKNSSILLLIFGGISILAFVSIGIYNAAGAEISEIAKTYGSSFYLVQMRDDNNVSMWEERNFEGGFSVRVYIGPRVDSNMAETVAKVEGIEHWEPYLETSVRPCKYKLISGYWGYGTSLEQIMYLLMNEMDDWEREDVQAWLQNNEMCSESNKYITYEYAVRDSTYYSEFMKGNFRLSEGRHIQPEDEHVAIVSQTFAELNHLKLGDTLIIDTDSFNVRPVYPSVSLGAVEVKIIGLFSMTYQQAITHYTEEGNIMENWIIVDMQTGIETEQIYGRDGDQWSSVLFYVDDPSRLDGVMEQVSEMSEIDWSYFYLKKNDTPYSDAVAPLKTMRIIMVLILAVILTAGMALVALLISHAVKRRRRECGIFMALGISAGEIRNQIILEYFLIGLAALIFAGGVSRYVAPTVGNQLLAFLSGDSEQKVYTQEEIEAAIMGGDSIKAMEMAQIQPQTVSTPDSLDIQIGLWQIFAVGATGLVVIGYSVNRIVKKTLRLSPRKVLSMIE